MNEVIFLIEDAPEGGYTARALGESIFTEARDLDHLQEQVRDAVLCHYEEEPRPKLIRLHFVREVPEPQRRETIVDLLNRRHARDSGTSRAAVQRPVW